MAIFQWHLNEYRPPKTAYETAANNAPREKSGTTQRSTEQSDKGQLKLFGFRKKGAGATLALPASVKKDVFLNAILETPTAKPMRRNPLEWAGATLLHVGIVAALIIIPLYTTGAIHLPEYDAVPLVAPPPPPPPAPVAAAVAPRVVRPHTAQLTYKVRKITAPTAIPTKVALGDASAPPPDFGSAAGVPGGVPGGQIGGVVGGVLGGTGASAPPPPPTSRKATPKIVRVGSNLKAPRQTYSVEPEYPSIALQTHIHGTVVVDAIIDERGNVVQAKAIGGHPLLIPPALRAVLQWKYEPTSLDGRPISVELEVLVNFR